MPASRPLPVSATPLGRARLSRRRFLAGGTVGAAGLAMLRCGGSPGAGNPTASPSATTAASPPAPTSPPAASPTPRPRRSGTIRVASANTFTFDTFDVQRSGEVTTLEILARTHSRLVQWRDFEDHRLGPDLALRWENPDAQTLLLYLDPAARWDDRSPTNGRAVTAEDVVAHIQRWRSIAASGPLPAVQRAQDVKRIRSVGSPGPGIVRIETAGPDPFILHTLASRFALVQAPEVVRDQEKQLANLESGAIVGSGAWRFDGPHDNGDLRFAARGGIAGPQADRLLVAQPQPARDAFLARELDELLCRDRRDAPIVRAAGGGARETSRFEPEVVLSTMFVGAPPWNDARLRRALSGALNRERLSAALFGGRSAAASAIAPVFGRFAPGAAQVEGKPGFRADPAADAGDAKKAWDAAGGPALGTVTIDFPSVFDPLYSASSVVIGMLNGVLGPQFRPAVETYTTISKKAVERRYGSGSAAFWFGWGPPLAEPDPSRWLAETYHSDSASARAVGYKDTALDAQLTRLLSESDLGVRQEMTRDLAARLLDSCGGGVIDWLQQRFEVFRWDYLERAAATPWWSQHLDSSASLGMTAPVR